ncbi:hypothetical protein SISSUDRAFT_1129124 [Sistotremastrum suecicum HHB10207 ss-3]|uniref:F-box domain-containing protein n=1 Tax=Sistotremastrum suecicum HHB10207 ss-3 TaxID=1314776 RepID=A0A166D0V1_9AGAM|nr:hypothetical protein SISSUDRAFT_1129124 [Sistotremastrum suecicum HHB10207 ss-3]
MLSNIPEEIFHRIMWHHRFSHQERLALLPHREHLQIDRQFRFYTLPDFQNARLVCRLWNTWLSNDFAFWRHFCIEGEKSLAIAKIVTSRFPSHPFHIRIRVDHADIDEFHYYDYSDDSASETDDDIEDPVAEVVHVPDDVVVPDVVVQGDDDIDFEDIINDTTSEESEDSESEDSDTDGKSKVVRTEPTEKLPGPWLQEAIDLVSKILPQLEALSVRLPTQIIHNALIQWAKVGAHNLRRCSLEAADYDGRTVRDRDRYLNSANPKAHKPLPPPLAPFLSQSPILDSIIIRNYYIPICAEQDIGFDPARLERFSVTYDELDSVIIGPVGADVKARLLIPTVLEKCRVLALDLDVMAFELSFSDLDDLPDLKKVTLGHGTLTIRSSALTAPLPSVVNGCEITSLTLSNMYLSTDLDHGVSSYHDIIQFLLEEIPTLESLCLIDVRFAIDPSPNGPPQSTPRTTLLPNFKRLLIEDGTMRVGPSPLLGLIPLLKRTPSLRRLTFTWMKNHADEMENFMTGLGSMDDDAGILCPKLRLLQILVLDMYGRPRKKMVRKISDELDRAREIRRLWSAEEKCISLLTRSLPLSVFRRGYYGYLI